MSDKKLRVGVVGCGMGKAHAGAFKLDERVELVAMADVNAEALASVKEKFQLQSTYLDAKAMFKEAGLDAVSIAVPNMLHKELSIAALEAGCHVLCEKPLAMNVEEAEAMQACADQQQKNLMVNFSFRYHPTSQSLKAQIDAGRVGEIYAGRTCWHRRRGLPGFGGWFGNQSMSGGGPLIDLGVHRIDLALWLMGYPKPVSVSGCAYDRIAKPLAEAEKKHFSVEDMAMGFVRFENGASLNVEFSWAGNRKEREFMETQLYGDRGGLVQRNIDQGYEFEAECFWESEGSHYTQQLDIAEDPKSSTYREFVSSILEQRAPTATADQGIQVQKILEGLYTSAKEGREVRF